MQPSLTSHTWIERRGLWLILATAFISRALVFTYIMHEPLKFYTYDSDEYDQRALNLLRYHVFAGQTQPPFTPDLIRTPTYPLFLAAIYAVVGHIPAIAVLVQIVLGSLTAGLTFVLAHLLDLPIPAGLLAALAVALDPVSALTSNRLLTETLFTTLLVTSLVLLVLYWRTSRWRWLLLSAAIIALSVLARPIAQFFPFMLWLLFAVAARQARWRALVTAGLVFAGTQWVLLGVRGFAMVNLALGAVWLLLALRIGAEYRRLSRETAGR